MNLGGNFMKRILGVGVFLAFVFCLFVSVPVRAQVTGATLSGTVTDASGAVVAGAQISAKNNATGTSREVTSDSSGLYSIPNLVPGDYEVRVTAKGFSTAVQSSLSLAVGQQQQLNFSLKVGETATTVQVTEAAPQVELTSSALTGQVEAETVRELPLNGRDWTQLATLQPGVKRIETQMSTDTSARGNRGFGAELTVSGQRSTFNNYRIDGISVVDYAVAAPGNVIGGVVGVDSIQEFSVLTGGFPAEYGRAVGGVVNAISKSGTNAFHGDVYEFIRNSALDANTYILRATQQPRGQFRRNQFGASAGGAIIKDKTFIFGDYEGLRQGKGISGSGSVPSDLARSGTFYYSGATPPAHCLPVVPATTPTTCQVTLNNVTPGVNAYANALLALYPHALPGTVGAGSNTGLFASAGLQIVPENFYTARVDHKLGNNDSLFGTYLFDDTDYKQPDAFQNVLTNSHTTRTTVAIEENHTFGSSFVNAARIGYNRDHVVNQFTPTAINSAAADKNLGSTTGQTAPRISPHGGVSDIFGGTNSGSHYLHTWNSYQYYDDAFWTHGTHTIKFGAGVERMLYNQQTFQNPGGRWQFNNFINFMAGAGRSFEAGLPAVLTPREFRQTLFGAYVQDDWKMRSNLTLNIGLRYEMTTVLKDGQGKITNMLNIIDSAVQCGTQFTAPVATQAGSSCSSVGPYYSNPTLRNFEPRLGFAWDPFRDGKTSVRGGFGIYDVQPFAGYFLLQQNQAAPFSIFKSDHSVSDLAGKFNAISQDPVNNGQAALTNSPLGRLSTSTIETHPHRNYVMQWNLNVQRQITSDMSLTIGYLGSRGVHLMMRGDDGNMDFPTKTSAGYLFPCGFVLASDTDCTAGFTGGTLGAGGATSAQLNQALGIIRYIYWNTDSNYHALNVNLDKRFTRGFQFQVAYTWAKSLDDDSQTIAGDSFGNGVNSPIWFLPKLFYGPSDFDVRHTISINGLYTIPTPKSFGGFAKAALGGWELGSILSINSGAPTTPIVANDPLGLGNSGADQFGPVLRVPNCDPYNHGYPNSKPGAPLWIKASCFTLPTVATSSLASLPYPCAPYSGAAAAPSGQTYCANLLPGNIGRNNIFGPRLFNLDFSVLKNFPVKSISEAFNIQFRAEMFNITNHDNFVPPQPDSGDGRADLFDTDGSLLGGVSGTLKGLATEPREVQFALKFVW
jgi:hypothetical protein